MAFDTYFKGNSQDERFCEKAEAGGNHTIAVTADGRRIKGKGRLLLRERELAPVLAAYRALPEAERRPTLPDPAKALPPERPLPTPPKGGLILKAYCTYLRQEAGAVVRAKEFYYPGSREKWAAETQSDALWLTEAERKALVPADPKVGDRVEAALPVRERFFGTVGIDYMLGSISSLPTRASALTLTVEEVTEAEVRLRLDGYGEMGRAFDIERSIRANSRGCELRVLGFATYDREHDRFTRFDVVGVGRAWGKNMGYISIPVKLESLPWGYGIVCELVSGDDPAERIPPYNMLHYNRGKPYFPPAPKKTIPPPEPKKAVPPPESARSGLPEPSRELPPAVSPIGEEESSLATGRSAGEADAPSASAFGVLPFGKDFAAGVGVGILLGVGACLFWGFLGRRARAVKQWSGG